MFGVLRQYYDHTGFADYRQTFDPSRQVIVDTQPYPRHDRTQCPYVSAAYPTCIGDRQVQSELPRLIIADELPTAGQASAEELSDNAPIYLVIVPGDVGVCAFSASRCLDTNVCAYHSHTVDHGQNVLYAVDATDGTSVVEGKAWPELCQGDNLMPTQEPNGDFGDVALSNLSHELGETITDPIGPAVIRRRTSTSARCFVSS